MKSIKLWVAAIAATLATTVLVPTASAASVASKSGAFYIVSEVSSGRHVVRAISAQQAAALRSRGIVVGEKHAFSIADTVESPSFDETPVTTTVPPTEEPPTTTTPPDTSAPVIERRENVVAVIDTGVQTSNPALAGSLLPGANFREESNSEAEPWLDRDGHGTAVAGVVLAHNPAALILPVRVLGNEGTGSSVDVVKGIYWAVDNGAAVINLSLGGSLLSLDRDPMVHEALRNAVSRGVVVVAASGNAGAVGSPLNSPASFEEAISVASVDRRNKVSWFSSRRQDVDIAARGQDVKVLSLKGGTETESGTSFAAPVVSAAASQLLTVHPEWGVEAVRNQLLATAKDAGPKGPDALYGFGILNVRAALTKPLMAPVGVVPAPRPFTKLKVEQVQGGVVLSVKRSDKPVFVANGNGEAVALSPKASYFRVEATSEFRVWTYDKTGAPTQVLTPTFTGSEAPTMNALAFRKGSHTYVKVLTKLPKGLKVSVSATVKSSRELLYSTTSDNRPFEAFSTRVQRVTVCFKYGAEITFGCVDLPVKKR